MNKYKEVIPRIPNNSWNFFNEVYPHFVTDMNVKELREKAGLSQQELANETGIPKDRIGKWEQGKGSPKAADTETLMKFFEEYVPRETKRQHTNGSGAEEFLKQRREQKGVSKPFMVPIVPVKAQAGYAASYNSTDFISQLEMRPILSNIDPRGAVWRFFEVQGDSMEPALFETDLVLVSMVPHADWQDIKRGQVYVIVTHDDVFIKQVYPNDKETWILRSVNKRKGDKPVKVSDIKEVWRYRRHETSKINLPK